MRQLHVIGFTSDHAGLILAGRQGAKTGSFVLQIDDALLDRLGPGHSIGAEDGADVEITVSPASPAVDGQAALTQPPRPSVQSGLSPREIQARLRAGRTVEEVAAEAGVGTDWVDRFAAPVLAEQAAAVARAGDSTLHTARKGQSDRPLEASVLRNLADRNVMMTAAEFASGWSAMHLIDHDWLVRFRFRSRGRAMVAEWNYDTGSGMLTSRNRLGLELGFVDPGRPAAVLADIEASEAPRIMARKVAAPNARRGGTRRPAAPKVATTTTTATAAPGPTTGKKRPVAAGPTAAKRAGKPAAAGSDRSGATKRLHTPTGGADANGATRTPHHPASNGDPPAGRPVINDRPTGPAQAGAAPATPAPPVPAKRDRTTEVPAAVDRPGPPD